MRSKGESKQDANSSQNQQGKRDTPICDSTESHGGTAHKPRKNKKANGKEYQGKGLEISDLEQKGILAIAFYIIIHIIRGI